MEIAALALLSAAVKKIVDFVRYAKAGDWSSVVTQIVAWLSGVAAVIVAAHADILGRVAVAGFPLAAANGASLVVLGVSLASGGSLITDAIKGIDATQSAAVPPFDTDG